MKKGLTALFVVLLTACSTTFTPPIDDAYHWSRTSSSVKGSSSAPAATPQEVQKETTQPEPASTPYEYVNVQDTTVTIKINR